MDAFDLSDLEAARIRAGRAYLEFLRVPDLSAGLYVIDAGGLDRQSPHSEDEVYLVLAGRARIGVAEEVGEVGPGSVVFVAAGVPHRFQDVTERLSVLVVFGPAEGARAADGRPEA